MNTSRLLTWSLIVAIVVVLNLLFSQVVRVVFTNPDYNTFCPATPAIPPSTEVDCAKMGGQWNFTTPDYQNVPKPLGQIGVTGYCNTHYKCSMEYETARKVFDKNAFMLQVALAAIALVLAYTLKMANPVSLGLAWGGVAALVISSAGYWNELGDLVRLLMLLILLGILIWFGIKKFQTIS